MSLTILTLIYIHFYMLFASNVPAVQMTHAVELVKSKLVIVLAGLELGLGLGLGLVLSLRNYFIVIDLKHNWNLLYCTSKMN